MKLPTAILSLLFATATPILAQDHFDVPKRTEFFTLTSDAIEREYQIMVITPGSYAENPGKQYAAIYLTDAQWDLSLVSSMIGKLNYDRSLLELVIVGISYPGKDANYDALRGRDLSPTRVAQMIPDSGGAGEFLEFIETGIIPEVERRYRIDPEKRALGGVSFGGLFSLYAMFEKPELFDRYISISPAVIWDDHYIAKREAAFAKQHDDLPVRLFLAYGGGEFPAYTDPIKDFQTQLNERGYKDFALLNWTIEGERHGGVAADGWTRGLRWVFKDVTPYRPGPIEEMFAPTGP